MTAMSKRDRLSEIVAIKQRGGARRRRIADLNDLVQLKKLWAATRDDTREIISNLLPIRIVTLIEVLCRYSLEILIDRESSPYAERAARLKIDLKFDFDMVQGLQGRLITLGQLIAHAVPLSNVGNIATAFSTLLDTDLFQLLATTRTRLSIEHDPDGAPIIDDIDVLRKRLARLFEVRHILTHEFPSDPPHRPSELDEFLDAAEKFMNALDEALTQLLFGQYPISQQAMNRDAHNKSEAASAELEALCDEIAGKWRSPIINKVQRSWKVFQQREAHRRAEGWTGGTAYPAIFHSAAEAIARDRISQLREWIEDEFLTWGMEGVPADEDVERQQ
jgi:hypothetical protein